MKCTLHEDCRASKSLGRACAIATHGQALRTEYRRRRALGHVAHHAWKDAMVVAEFRRLEYAGFAKLEHAPDDHFPYDMSYVDTWGLSPSRVARVKADLAKRIREEWVWSLIVWVRTSIFEPWERSMQTGGFIGRDGEDSGYDVDLMRAAVELVRYRLQDRYDETLAVSYACESLYLGDVGTRNNTHTITSPIPRTHERSPVRRLHGGR